MGRAIDLFVTYRFIKLLVTPFEKTDAYRLGIIDKKGNRIMPPPTKGGVRQTKPKHGLHKCRRGPYNSKPIA